MTTPTTASISGSSYAISCPAALNPPISEYLFADDHPAVNTPIVPNELIASAKKTPNSKSATTNVGLMELQQTKLHKKPLHTQAPI